MRFLVSFLFLPCPLLFGEIRQLTLREAVDLALRQNPEVLMARLEEHKATAAVQIARDPFSTKVVGGSGLAYSSGYPLSIEGSAPSIFQAQAIRSLINRPKSFDLEQAKANARGQAFDTGVKQDEVVLRVATLFLDAERAQRWAGVLRQQAESFERIASATQARVNEGRDLALENTRAALALARSRQRLSSLEADVESAERNLALLLGFSAEDRVRPRGEERAPQVLPPSEQEGVELAIANNKEIKRLESALQARGWEAKSARAARMPQLDLVAQYGLFAKFNNFEDYFQRFQYNNAQVGVSIKLPLFAGAGVKGAAARADAESERLRLHVTHTRNRIAVDTKKSFRDVQRAEQAREVAKLDLDLSREQVGVALAQMEEGRAGVLQVEQLRAAEAEKWLILYDAQQAVEQARLEVLRQAGTITAALR